MWTVVGPFDGGALGQTNFAKHKVLKAGKSYPLGRHRPDGHPLSINSKKVSKDFCDIVVGTYTLDNLSDSSFIPPVEVVNTRKKMFKINRGKDTVPCNEDSTVVIEDGDVLCISSGVSASIVWVPQCLYSESPRAHPFSHDGLAALATSLVHTPSTSVTHHVASELRLSACVGASLISSCNFVKPDWVTELLRKADLPPDDPDSLENHSNLPNPTKFLPGFHSSVPKALQKKDLWTPNEARIHVFRDLRFLCVGEKSREIDSELRAMIERGGGVIETFNVKDGTAKWRKSLSRGSAKEGQKMVGVADVGAMHAVVGESTWLEFVKEAAEFNVHFFSAEQLVEVIVKMDVSSLRAGGGFSQSQASVTLPTEESESTPPVAVVPDSPPPARRRAPPRRATSRQPSQDIDSSAGNPETANSTLSNTLASTLERASQETGTSRRRPLKKRVITEEEKEDLGIMTATQEPKRPLTRRAQGGLPVITGIDDDSILLDEPPAAGSSAPSEIQTSMPPPRSARRPLKRRHDTIDDTLDDDTSTLASGNKPSYKKHKALFDSLDPEKAGITFDGTQFNGLDTLGGSATQSQTQATGERPLYPVFEEEEETQATLPPQSSRGQKRKMTEDIEMADVDAALIPSPSQSVEPPPSKKRAVENVNAVEKLPTTVVHDGEMRPPPSKIKPSKSAKPGAEPGQPDKDVAFLKALASTKKGKKHEDDFDREFNKLKISKPDLEDGKEDSHEQWKVLDDFEEDRDIRGNFMVVVEFNLPQRSERSRSRPEADPSWGGKPNFKKFKKKDFARTRSKPIDLVISDVATLAVSHDQPYPVSQTQTQNQTSSHKYADDTIEDVKPIVPKAPSRDSRALLSDSDEDSVVAMPAAKSKAKAKAKPQPRATKVKSQSQAPAALFLDISDDDDDAAKEDDDVQTLASAPPTKAPPRRAATRNTKKASTMVDDDDSDEDAIFKPRATRSRKR